MLGMLPAPSRRRWGVARPLLAVLSLAVLVVSPLSAGTRTVPNFVRACIRIAATHGAGYYRIVAKEYRDGRDYRTGLQFAFCPPSGACRSIFVYKTSNVLDYMVPASEGSVLITVWESGSAVWTRAFRLTPTAVSMVLDRGAHFAPELTADAILIDTGWVPGPSNSDYYHPNRAEIWTWTREKYRLVTTVPFDQRYEALAKLLTGADDKCRGRRRP